MVEVPGVARPRPSAHPYLSGRGGILERSAAVPVERVAHGVFAIGCADRLRRVLLKAVLHRDAAARRGRLWVRCVSVGVFGMRWRAPPPAFFFKSLLRRRPAPPPRSTC